MADDFVDSKGPRAATSRVSNVAPIEETIEENHFSRAHGGGREESYADRIGDRAMPKSVLDRLDEISARDSGAKAAPVAAKEVVEDAPAGDAPKAETPSGDTAKADAPAAADAKPDAPPPAPPSPDAYLDQLKAERDRVIAANQKLVADLEQARANPTRAPHALLTEAADSYIEDSSQALRKFVAASLGITDPTDKRVDAEIRDLYTDLTASELGVTPDLAHQAKRDAARARQLLEREKRERTAKAEPPASQPDATATFIGNRLATAAPPEKFPLLMALSEQLDGKKPHDLLAEVIRRETKTGRIPVTPDDDAMIAAAAKIVEDHYTQLSDRIASARKPSTVQPTTQPSQSASNDQRQQPAARNLTSADASVAPSKTPTTPAPKTEEQQPKKFKSDKERREWALRHIPDRR